MSKQSKCIWFKTNMQNTLILFPLKRPYTGPIAINIYLTLTPYRSDLNAKFLPTTESGMVKEDG